MSKRKCSTMVIYNNIRIIKRSNSWTTNRYDSLVFKPRNRIGKPVGIRICIIIYKSADLAFYERQSKITFFCPSSWMIYIHYETTNLLSCDNRNNWLICHNKNLVVLVFELVVFF